MCVVCVGWGMGVCVCVMYVCMYICMYVYMSECICVCMSKCMFLDKSIWRSHCITILNVNWFLN
jgi:hypothetical protein